MHDSVNEQAPYRPSAPSFSGQPQGPVRKNNILAGVFILMIGLLLLLRQTGVLFPGWLFTWPVLLIALGVFGAIKTNFKPGGWMALLLIGGVFLLDRVVTGFSLRPYIWPVLIMMAGLWMIIRPKVSKSCSKWSEENEGGSISPFTGPTHESASSNEVLEITSIFGGVKKIVLSKSFRGGEVVCIMGGSEINLMQADFQQTITLEATNIFGGTKLIIPPSWDVQSEVVAIFGGVDDKRQIIGETGPPQKVLRLEGTCLFGGIEIRSY